MIKLPNIRKLFIPDRGKVICDVDLSGADAQVVAWEARDEPLKDAFRKGLKIHVKNFEDMWERPFTEKDKTTPVAGRPFTPYDEMKRAVHGTNYGASARTVAITLSWSVAEAERFQSRWFNLHPGIHEWHRRTEHALQTTRTVRNAFGFRIVYFDRPDQLLPKALAWTPQSTVAIVCGRGAVRLARIPYVEVLLQVHDSLVFQIPIHRVNNTSFQEIQQALENVVPYPDPLTIAWELAISEKTWGDVKKRKWKEEKEGVARHAESVL